ncbi:hypothetical protein Tsubulata_033284 [Turnera subulata]|uniref:Beta-galactosidase n=1 Tax=Turnera subulata TaxID=218843 RepID=A0A9Q0F3Q6_9ROSI|nr:hypothetical protein Tsubulata_033284 [Turnera subulata]
MGDMFPASALVLILISLSSLCFAFDVTYDNRAIKIDGERKLIISGSIHYPRSTPQMWPSLIKNAKAGGLNAIETYVMTSLEGLTWLGSSKTFNAKIFMPFFGLVHIGFPVWLKSLPGIELRTNNDVYKNEMRTFTTLIVNMLKKHRLFASQGGPVILAQIENEYGNVEWAYGDAGRKYVEWCKDTALGYKLDIPWIMCQQDNAPSPMISACNGWYCDQWNPKSNSTPKIWTENWTGWFKDWGNPDPHRPAEDLAFSVARFFQLGGSLQNYYMYHGGTNFGETAGGPYITTSYDYDAPLDEFGNLNQPKWGHLKDLHLVLRSMEKILLYGDRVDHNHDQWGAKSVTVYSYRGQRACFFSNSDATQVFTVDFEGVTYHIPPWTTTILEDCYKEVYSTSKVNAQTSTMIMTDPEPEGEDEYGSEEAAPLEWQWTTESVMNVDHYGLLSGTHLVSKQLLDQKIATNGTSDHLWVLTSIDINKTDPVWGKGKINLQVKTEGHKAVKDKFLKDGKNYLSFLSSTVGLQNYGDHFDNGKNGILGPIKLIAKTTTGDVEKDISSSQWIYKTGLQGVQLGFQSGNSPHARWQVNRRPSNKELVWYKTTFPTPLGTDPVVVDLRGLGKGAAWVNGNHIGRYWPAVISPEDKCSIECRYAQTYKAQTCYTNCGKPTQRWYHIPRDFLRDDRENDLVLFEELGGTPELVRFKTVTIGSVCLHAYNHQKVFSDIKFASFGLPEGGCSHFRKTRCHAPRTQQIIEDACLGQKSCTFDVSQDTFGVLEECESQDYRLAVEAVCSLCFAFDVTYDNRAIKIDGERKLIISGSIHYPRSTPQMWPSLIKNAKAGGLNAIETYVMTSLEGLTWLGSSKTFNVKIFMPFFGLGHIGFPVWLKSLPGIELRTNNDVYKNEMRTFTTLIVNMLKKHRLFASQGGPVILAQIENEYGNVEWAYGDAGWKYVEWCKDTALGYKLDIPWIMCQQDNAPSPMISACNGWYCDQWNPKSNSTPKIWTENWTGWFKDWGSPDPHRPAEDLAFSVARFFQLGGSLQNYYMYHGGTNFGETAGGPYITTSYDYDAPLDEFGNLNQPKWGHLKELHLVLRSMEKILLYGDRVDHNHDQWGTRSVTIPLRFSLLILRELNTTFLLGPLRFSKVNAQTSIMIKADPEPEGEDDYGSEEAAPLEWQWTTESVLNVDHKGLLSGSHLVSKQLLDQKIATNGTSDHLWVLTSMNIDKTVPAWGEGKIFLQVKTEGHNYGDHFDNGKVGILGPIKLVARTSSGDVVKDISASQWIYKPGLQGVQLGFHSGNSRHARWQVNRRPSNKELVWYKTTFPTPLGTDPVVVDLQGLGKGAAWVNGFHIGRYHIPRDFLRDDGENDLVLFEELGGTPELVKFKTVTVGSVCLHAYNHQKVTLSCQGGRVFSDIKFASFGLPEGGCSHFRTTRCHAPKTRQIIEDACLGQKSCTFDVSQDTFGVLEDCKSQDYRLAVEAVC